MDDPAKLFVIELGEVSAQSVRASGNPGNNQLQILFHISEVLQVFGDPDLPHKCRDSGNTLLDGAFHIKRIVFHAPDRRKIADKARGVAIPDALHPRRCDAADSGAMRGIIQASDLALDIYITTDIGRQWGSDAGVRAYFEGQYPSGTVDYTTHSGSIQLPTRRGSGAPQESADKQDYGTDTVFGDISHYRQVGYNEIGKDMAHNLFSSLYGQSSAQSIVVTKRDGKAIDPAQTLVMTPGETLELTLMPNPVSVNDLEIVCTGNALQRISENAFVYQCIAGGTGEIQVKQGGRILASYTVKCVSGAWYRWHFSK